MNRVCDALRPLALAAALALAGCGGGGDDPAPAPPPSGGGGGGTPPVGPLNASFVGWPYNLIGQPFDRTLDITVTNGSAALGGLGTYTLAAPVAGAPGGCTVTGGGGTAALTQCAAQAEASLLVLCTAGTRTEADAVLVRSDAQTRVANLSLADLRAAVGSAGMRFEALRCDGTLNANDRMTLAADGSLSFVVDEPGTPVDSGTLSASALESAFSAAGLSIDGDRIGIRAWRHTANGVTTHYLVAFGAPGASSIDADMSPVLFVQRP